MMTFRKAYTCELCGWELHVNTKYKEDLHAVWVHENRLCKVRFPNGDPFITKDDDLSG